MMTITGRQDGAVGVLTLGGAISGADDSTERLGQVMREMLGRGTRQIVLDVTAVAHVDSAGLGALVECHISARRQGGSTRLIGVNGKLSDLLVITKLATVFDVCDSEKEAIASFTLAR